MSKVEAIDYSSLMSKTKKRILLPEGVQESVVYGVVFLDSQTVKFEGQDEKVQKQLKVLVEFPNFKNDDKSLVTLSTKAITCTNSDKGNLLKLFSAAVGKTVTTDELGTALETNGLADFLNKKVGATIEHWDNGSKHSIKTLTGLPAGKSVTASNKTFIFHPMFPDIDVFTNQINYYLQKAIMSSVNASEFPIDLHEAWKESQIKQKARDDKYSEKQTSEDGGVI